MKYIAIIISFLLLAGCATLSPAPSSPQVYHYVAPSQRVRALSQITRFNIQAAIGVRLPQKNVMGHLNWQQQGLQFTGLLEGPLGLGGVRIAGEPGHFILWKSAKQYYTSSNVKQLMEEQLGWSLPVTHLFYWVRSIPAPGKTQAMQFDHYGHLIRLIQYGWQIRYTNFQTVRGVDLPCIIYLTAPDVYIKVVITRWALL